MEPRTMVPSMGLDRRFQTMKYDRKWYTYNDIPRRSAERGQELAFTLSVVVETCPRNSSRSLVT